MKTFKKISAGLLARVRWFGISRLIGCIFSVVLVVVAGWWLVQVPPPPPEASLAFATTTTGSSAGSPASTGAAQLVTVHVAGAVKTPGIYRLRQGARVNDGVVAAGGATSAADLDSINLATVLSEGEQIYIPKRGEKPHTILSRPQFGANDQNSANGVNSANGAGQQININLASAIELEQLPGVGPATATAIVAYREKNGAFNTVEDLLNVRGIGPAKLNEILPRARVR